MALASFVLGQNFIERVIVVRQPVLAIKTPSEHIVAHTVSAWCVSDTLCESCGHQSMSTIVCHRILYYHSFLPPLQVTVHVSVSVFLLRSCVVACRFPLFTSGNGKVNSGSRSHNSLVGQ